MKKVYTYFLLIILCAGPFITHCSTPSQPPPQPPTETPAVLPQEASICELSPELDDVRVKFAGEISSLDTADLDVIKLLAVDPGDPQCQVWVWISWRVYQSWTTARQSYLAEGKLLRFAGMAYDEDGMMVVHLLDNNASISPAARP